MEYLNAARTVATYVSEGGEHAFLRVSIDSLTPEVYGVSGAVTDKTIAEAVFVDEDDAAIARVVLAGRAAVDSLTDLLNAHGIRCRLPRSSWRRAAPAPTTPHPTTAPKGVVEITTSSVSGELTDTPVDTEKNRRRLTVVTKTS